jgi:hypothetical protein
MSNIISKYIEPIESEISAVNTIVNSMVFPSIQMFCEIPVFYETGARLRDGSYKFSYGNWNRLFEPEVFLNGSDVQLNPSQYSVDYEKGIITPSFQRTTGDNILCSYNFSWFDADMLQGFVERSVATINYGGQGAISNYTIKDLPEGWYGISADLVVAMCMENLILAYTMWAGKLIFSISANQMYDGSDSIVSQLETIKRNCEERAYKAIENPQLRASHTIATPTPAYYRAITIGNGIRRGPHGGTYGKSRGIKLNKYYGYAGGDTNEILDV